MPADLLDGLVERLADAVAARVVLHLGGTQVCYSTRRGQEPPGYARRRWLSVAPKIPGATKRGRWWTVPAAALAEWERTSAPTKRRSSVVSGPWSPAGALVAAGARGSR